jgi:uncharacterized YccA/Bax inhibitor family protein
MRSANPVLNERVFRTGGGAAVLNRPFDTGVIARPTGMTIEGTVYKTGFLLLIVIASAALSWQAAEDGRLLLPGVGVTFFLLLGIAMATAFRPRWAIVTGPAYALISGLILGAVSAIFEAAYGGIVGQAVIATMGTTAGMLIAYRTEAIRVTPRFRKVVITATLGIMLLYVVSIVMRLFGAEVPLLHDSGPLGIAISVFIVAIAALNLILDFEFVAQASRAGADKRMEWYGAFAIMVTLVWLYLEILRLLSKLRD